MWKKQEIGFNFEKFTFQCIGTEKYNIEKVDSVINK